jgi:hypothetical protein
VFVERLKMFSIASAPKLSKQSFRLALPDGPDAPCLQHVDRVIRSRRYQFTPGLLASAGLFFFRRNHLAPIVKPAVQLSPRNQYMAQRAVRFD